MTALVLQPAGMVPSQAMAFGTLDGPATQVDASNPLPVSGAPVGITASASFTPVAGVYSANDIISVAQEFVFTFADGRAIPSGSLIRILDVIIKIDQTALQASEGAYALQCYSATPPSGQLDNAAWSLASADLSVYRDVINIGTPVDLGAACYLKTRVDAEIKLTGTSLFGELQTLAGFTLNAAARQILLYGIVL